MSAAAHPHTIGTSVVVIRGFEYYGRPSDPFNATAKGALVAAQLEMSSQTA